MPSSPITLLCTLHPKPGKEARVLSLLRHGAKTYYTRPSSQCTTWSYFTPFPPPKPSTISSAAKNTDPKSNTLSSSPPTYEAAEDMPAVTLCGVEVYSDKAALSRQLEDREFFQDFQKRVGEEGLLTGKEGEGEEMVAWYFWGGFLVREGREAEDGRGKSGGGGYLVSLTRIEVKGGEEGRGEVLEGVMGSFAKWVEENEPDVLTYAVFTRPKNSSEILLWVRYRDGKALKSHGGHPEHLKVVKKLEAAAKSSLGKSTTMWQEVEDSFVSNVDGGGKATSSKL